MLDPPPRNEMLVLVGQVLETTPRMQQERARLEGIEQAVKLARAKGLPEIKIQGSASTATGDYDLGDDGQRLLSTLIPDGGSASPDGAFDDFGSTNPRRVQLSIVQPLYTGFRIKNGQAQARATVVAAQADFIATRQRMAVHIADAILSADTAQGRREVAEKSVALLIAQVRAAQISFETGTVTKTDVALAEARLAAAQAQLAAAGAEVIATQSAFKALAGTSLPKAIYPRTPLNVPLTVDEAVGQAMDGHPSLAAAKAISQARLSAEKVAKGMRAPSLQLRGSVSYGRDNFIAGDERTSADLVAEFELPLYQGGDISAQIAQTRAETRASRFAVTAVERQIEAEVLAAAARYRAAVMAQVAADAQLTASDLAYRGVVLEQEVGQRSILDVLRVEESLLDARLATIEASRRVILASYLYHQAIGDLLE